MIRRAAALALAAAIAAASGFGALVGVFWGFGLRCDDSCGTPPPWRNDPDAWQWEALGAVAIAVFGCTVLVLGAVALRRRLPTLAALAAWAVLAGMFFSLFGGSGLTSNPERGWAGLFALLVAGLAAIALTPERTRR